MSYHDLPGVSALSRASNEDQDDDDRSPTFSDPTLLTDTPSLD